MRHLPRVPGWVWIVLILLAALIATSIAPASVFAYYGWGDPPTLQD